MTTTKQALNSTAVTLMDDIFQVGRAMVAQGTRRHAEALTLAAMDWVKVTPHAECEGYFTVVLKMRDETVRCAVSIAY
jgi:hypothetical protein